MLSKFRAISVITRCVCVCAIASITALFLRAQTSYEQFWATQMQAASRAMADPTTNSRVRNIWFKLARYSNQMFPVVPAQQFNMGQALPSGIILLDLSAAGDDSPEVTVFWLSHEYGHQVLGHPRLSMTTWGRWIVAQGGTRQEDEADRWAGRFLRANDYRIEPVLNTLCSLPQSQPGDAHSDGKQRAEIVAKAYGLSTDDPCDSEPPPPPTTYSPTVRMWSKNEGDSVTFDFIVDENQVGSFNNAAGRISLTLDDIAEGQHSFTMSNITIYRVVQTFYGPRVQPVLSGLECSGTFRVRSSATLRLMAVLQATGEVQCSLR